MSFLLWPSAEPAFNRSELLPSIKGKVILVTGGTSGLGRQAVLEYARYGPEKIWLAARNAAAAEKVIKEIQDEVPTAPIEFIHLELTSVASIQNAAHIFRLKSSRLDILMLNAGIVATPPGLTEDGYEVQFGTNYIGSVLLAKLLSPTLLDTAETPEADVRIVFLGSQAASMAPTEGIIFEAIKTDFGEVGAWARYGQSKLAVILYARELAKRQTKIKVCVVDPGFVDTNWAQSWKSSSYILGALYPLMRMASSSVDNGVQNQLWASVHPDVKSGMYYLPVGKPAVETGNLANQKLGQKLWEWTETELEGMD
ncbi:short-chain dehydrogenase/reductase [Colletotrichum scovillei]|uniref:Short-chain dehydrogenase/reductase n=1 Tax=Colletotrichum scovillei TaxID=1209932 RepID=A0A9P7UAP7_9PEZI|nr:short-chain dehydrogenase/reductase [Colletotrichum scovillei]KAF4778587.1 short-chain dehydrogenase/reductase [Colletotrichum scovillei]KAG7044259.1 short-chain dehydrogenase/reductase [Colletotrichum scovillei]KAG7046360.1 short-chain dehydrogenase/reductase [Colletotrichum scovillei]KAG7063712.1 short-chain dehydrogenase/reductase [Colletotrichum scovillei]